MSLSDLLSAEGALKLMVLYIIYLSYFPIMLSISAEMHLAGMCLGSDLFGKSSPLWGINNLLATQINERQMCCLSSLLPVHTQWQLRETLGRGGAFDMHDGWPVQWRQCKCNTWRGLHYVSSTVLVFCFCPLRQNHSHQQPTIRKTQNPIKWFIEPFFLVEHVTAVHFNISTFKLISTKATDLSRLCSSAADRLDHRPSGD